MRESMIDNETSYRLPENIQEIISKFSEIYYKKGFLLTLCIILDRFISWKNTGETHYNPKWGVPISLKYIENRSGRVQIARDIFKTLVESDYIRVSRKSDHSEGSCRYYSLKSLKTLRWSQYSIANNTLIKTSNVIETEFNPFTIRKKCEVCDKVKTEDKFYNQHVKYCTQCWVQFKHFGRNIDKMRPYVSFNVYESVMMKFNNLHLSETL